LKLKKLIEEILALPVEIEIGKIETILVYFGWRKNKVKGSHFYYYKDGEFPLVIPTLKGREIKIDYIKKVIEFLNLEEWYENHKDSIGG